MIRKLFTIPEELDERLSKERNQSGTVVEALQMYYKAKDLTKQLTKLVQDFEESAGDLFSELDEIKRDVRVIKQKATERY